ncbi:MAG: glycosyltransferase family 4 protein [Haliea sp.]|nr:glycosyltransferase family 4 protein [Haliea sp.]
MISRQTVPVRIFIECTHTYFAGGDGGIRRVARNLANQHRSASSENVTLLPIVWAGRGFFAPRRSLTTGSHPLFKLRDWHARLGELSNWGCTAMASMANALVEKLRPLYVRYRYARLFGIARNPLRWLRAGSYRARSEVTLLVESCFTWVRSLMRSGAGEDAFYKLFGIIAWPLIFFHVSRVNFRAGDIVVLVDSTWNSPAMLEALLAARETRGIQLGVMLHDLFPLTIPEMCHPTTVSGYEWWFNRVAPSADFFLTNSAATGHSLDLYLEANPDLRLRPWRTGSFRLGAELSAPVETPLKLTAGLPCPPLGFVVLAVGTIEPRKNYAAILDALDMLWDQIGVTLILVGRPGWSNADIMQRIRSHRYLGTRLFHLDNADDADLEAAYQRAECLVCASWAEGFGLPIVEGLCHGLPVIASDIKVFREVGGDACRYFSANNPRELAQKLLEAEASNGGERGPVPVGYRSGLVISWEESAVQFRDTVMQLAQA